jgi:hypothetical protein
VTLRRTALVVLVPIALHALAREADRGLGLVLRSEAEPDGLLAEVSRGVAAAGWPAVARVVLWIAAGLAAWLVLAWARRRTARTGWSSSLAAEATVLLPLLLRPAMTLLALVSVAAHPSYPYGFTLPVALTQDWGLGQDLAAVAAIVALRVPGPRAPVPRAGEVLFLSFLVYALLVPGWAWRWEGHPGNEPKYLRQAVALGQFLTFDAEGVSAGMEDLPVRPLAQSLPAAASTLGRESVAMALALARGEVGRGAIRATRITRQTVRGKNGGVFYVLAPGPSLMLAPALRLDRAINRARGEPGRVPVSVLLWCALAALLVAALFRLVRDATGRPGLASVLAFGFALVPPLLFYSFQFYPEMVGALVFAVVFRTLALRPGGLTRHPWLYGWLLATLPWLHQKFLPAWLVLVATAVGLSFRGAPPSAGDEESAKADPLRAASAGSRSGPRYRPGRPASLRMTAGLLVPTLVSLYLTALYNFAITGSVRPDALFLAWGPGGVTSARVGQGVFGLLLDARYGILPYVPVLLLSAAGLVAGGARRFALVLPAAAVYYLTVASADNWAGAVCNLGRYFMPVAPLGVALVAIALSFRGTSSAPGSRRSPERDAVADTRRESTVATADPSSHGGTELVRMTEADPSSHGGAELVRMTGGGMPRGLLALFLMLAAWTAVFAVALWRDPHAANDSALLLAKSVYADAHRYIPDLFIRSWSDAAPGLWARVASWLAALAAIAWWRRRVSSDAGIRHRERSPVAVLATVTAVVLLAGFALEHWPTPRQSPSFSDSMVVPGASATVFLGGAARMRYDEAVLGPGGVELLLRSPTAVPSLTVTVGGQGSVLSLEGRPPIVLRPTGALVSVPFVPYHVVHGSGGRSVAFTRAKLSVAGEAVLRLGEGPVEGSDEPTAGGGEMEPEGNPDR